MLVVTFRHDLITWRRSWSGRASPTARSAVPCSSQRPPSRRINNGAWIAYFALERYWTALVPATSATVLAGMLAVVLIRRGQATLRPSVLIGAWAVLLVAAYPVVGRAGLGTLLTAAFFVQVAPSLWAAYRTARPTGISSGTWLLILGELSCWLVFGLYKSDPRLIALGVTGVIASTLILARIHRTSKREQPAAPRPAT